MCFICKLSFSSAKSFLVHCTTEHSLALTEREKEIFSSPAPASAILQVVGPDRAPLISVLEPVAEDSGGDTPSNTMCPPHSLGPSPRERPPQREESPGGQDREEAAPPQQQPPFPAFLPLSPTSPLLKTLRGLPGLGPAASLLSVMSGPGAAQLSPAAGSAPSSSTPTNASQLQGTTIGPCPEHVTGRQPGVECAKCDFILNSARLGEDFLNNPAKALKCPKCNWHYKYQETLEVHMKDKHPESTSHCIYCITGQQHPRLARGETYTCGYKPYRCEVCNYSTTTKGNLSIHMQSDKHINNMQELQSGGVVTASDGTKITQNILAKMPLVSQRLTASQPSTQQPSFWRCDICNFETNQPRNLRIHMTSEKHMNNIVNLQQMNLGNGEGPAVPNMPALPTMPVGGPPGPGPQLQQPNLQQLLGMAGPLGRLPQLPGPAQLPDSPMKEAAMADMAFNQAILMQMMGGAPPGFPGMPPLPGLPFLPTENQGDPMESEQPDPNPKFLYTCAVCRVFSTDSLQALSDHLSIDRTKLRENEVSIQIGGTFICKLCSYKTNLKANFQLHCKTDKHLQKLQLVNHIMEGGPQNEWKLNFMNVSNSVQLRCNACDFYTDSIHKLQIHSANQGHEVSAAIFAHLRREEEKLKCDNRDAQLLYNCTLCKMEFSGKGLLLQHCRSVKHLQMEQLHILQLRAEGGANTPEIGDIFTVTVAGSDKVDNDTSDSNKGRSFFWQCHSFIYIIKHN